MDDIIRIGRVSSIDGNGMIAVTYPDRGAGATAHLPIVSSGLYKPPKVGDMVVVAHIGAGSADGVVLGSVQTQAKDTVEPIIKRIEALEQKG